MVALKRRSGIQDSHRPILNPNLMVTGHTNSNSGYIALKAVQNNIRVSDNPTDPWQNPPTQKSFSDFWAKIGFPSYFCKETRVKPMIFLVCMSF